MKACVAIAAVFYLATNPATAADIIGQWRGQLVSPEGKTVTLRAELGCGDFRMKRTVDEPGQPGRATAGEPPVAAVPPHKRSDVLSGRVFYDPPELMFTVEQWSPRFGPYGAIPKPPPFRLNVIQTTEQFLLVEDPSCVENPGKLTGPEGCRFMLYRVR